MTQATSRPTATPAPDDLVGFQVEAVGGSSGKVDPVTRRADDRYLVVRTGRWPSWHRVVVPAGAVNCVDPQRRRLWVERDRDQVRSAPAFNESRHGQQNGSTTGEAR
jgi:hypothetical protein